MLTNLAAVTNEDGSITNGWGIALVIILGVLAVALLALVIAALVSIASTHSLTAGGKALWAVVVIVFPFLGSLAWFLWGRTAQLQRPEK